MSDQTAEEFNKSLRDCAGELAEAKWKADEERKKINIEAHTAFLVQHTESDKEEAVNKIARHKDWVRVSEEIAKTNERIAIAAERQADALDAIAKAMGRTTKKLPWSF